MSGGSTARDVANRVRLPVAPLEAVLRDRGETVVGVFGLGTAETRYVTRSRKRGWLTAAAADHLCVRYLRLHPATVFGDAYWEET